MKRIILILISFIAVATTASSQHLVMATIIEKTVAGNQYGAQMLLETKSQWSLGGFYQQNMHPSEGAHSLYPFYGATVNAPVMKSLRMNFYFNVRGGIVNSYFLVIAPGFETRLKLSNSISFSMLTSVRMGSPSVAFKVNVKI